MPVVTVTAPAHADIEDLLRSAADVIAGALGLGPADVVVTHVAAGQTVVNGADGTTDTTAAGVANGGAPAWPLVTIHGSDRGDARMEAARTAAEAAVRTWADRNAVEIGGVWTQWLTPRSTGP